MISYLKGLLIAKTADTTTVLVNDGVGYDVRMNPLEISGLITQTPIALHCYHHITDRSQELYGFLTPETKAIFVLLIENIAGIGPKSALKIIAKIDAQTLENAVLNKNASYLETLGIGRKTAEKIINGLSGKIALGSSPALHATSQRLTEAIDALLSLGYSKSEAEAALRTFDTSGKTIEEIIKDALRIAC